MCLHLETKIHSLVYAVVQGGDVSGDVQKLVECIAHRSRKLLVGPFAAYKENVRKLTDILLHIVKDELLEVAQRFSIFKGTKILAFKWSASCLVVVLKVLDFRSSKNLNQKSVNFSCRLLCLDFIKGLLSSFLHVGDIVVNDVKFL